MLSPNLLEKHDPVHFGHPDVQKNNVGIFFRHQVQDFRPVQGRDHAVTLIRENLPHGFADDVLVVHYQHGSLS